MFGGGFIAFSLLSIIIVLILHRKKDVAPAIDDQVTNKSIDNEVAAVQAVEHSVEGGEDVVVENHSAI